VALPAHRPPYLNLDDTEARQLDQTIAAEATGETTVGVRRLVKKAVLAVNPAAAARRRARAAHQRRLELRPAPDGMAELYELQPAERALLIWNVSHALAGPKHPDDTRSTSQRV
jgi:hypothetical protein